MTVPKEKSGTVNTIFDGNVSCGYIDKRCFILDQGGGPTNQAANVVAYHSADCRPLLYLLTGIQTTFGAMLANASSKLKAFFMNKSVKTMHTVNVS